MTTPLKLGVVGHRDLGDHAGHLFSQFACHQFLAEAKRKYPCVQAISAISEGADSIFARSALSLGIPLESIIPFESFSSDFKDELSYESYRKLRSLAVTETRTSFVDRSRFAYRKSMEWVVFKSDVIVAIWDEMEVGTIGGTWEAVSLAFKIKRKIVHIDNCKKSLNLYYDDGSRYREHRNVSIDMIKKNVLGDK